MIEATLCIINNGIVPKENCLDHMKYRRQKTWPRGEPLVDSPAVDNQAGRYPIRFWNWEGTVEEHWGLRAPAGLQHTILNGFTQAISSEVAGPAKVWGWNTPDEVHEGAPIGEYGIHVFQAGEHGELQLLHQAQHCLIFDVGRADGGKGKVRHTGGWTGCGMQKLGQVQKVVATGPTITVDSRQEVSAASQGSAAVLARAPAVGSGLPNRTAHR